MVSGGRDVLITILSNTKYMESLHNKLIFIRALQKEEGFAKT